MVSIFVPPGTAATIPIWFVTAQSWPDLRQSLDVDVAAFADAAAFEPKAGRQLLLPGKGGLAGVLFGLEGADEPQDPFLPGRLPWARRVARLC